MLTAEHIEAINWVAYQITKQKRRYDQNKWGRLIYGDWITRLIEKRGEETGKELLEGYCNTTQCVAGWALQYEFIKAMEDGSEMAGDIAKALGMVAEVPCCDPITKHCADTTSLKLVKKTKDVAMTTLGLTEPQALELFVNTDLEISAKEMASKLRRVPYEGWDQVLYGDV